MIVACENDTKWHGLWIEILFMGMMAMQKRDQEMRDRAEEALLGLRVFDDGGMIMDLKLG